MSVHSGDNKEGEAPTTPEDEIVLLEPKRYRPEGAPAHPDSPPDGSTPSTRSQFSFRRIARGVVDSLVPEPLRLHRIRQRRQLQLDLRHSGRFNASTEALYEAPRYEARPSSSVYDDNRHWPASTIASEGWTIDAAARGSFKIGEEELEGPYDRTSVSESQVRNAQTSPGSADDDALESSPVVDGSTKIYNRNLPFREIYQQSESERNDTQSEDLGDTISYEGEENIESADSESVSPAIDPAEALANKEEELIARVAALRIPTITSARRKQTHSLAATDDTSPLLQNAGEYVPFDPVDPYHHSGQPKKKTLYGPEGYLGKKKEWKQSHLQKMVTIVGSMGARVKNSIRRSLDRRSEDKRTELLHGIVMKPNIAINIGRQTQAEIYSKLEMLMCVAANEYLLTQLDHQRFVGNDSIKRFVDFWNEKNRPVVPEFQFDLKTQRDIVLHNVRSFEFTGKYGLDPVLLKSTLDAWGSVINQLNVRTFCWPDSAIKKLFHDVFPVLEMLDAAPEVMAVYVEMRRLVLELLEEAKHVKKVDKATFEPRDAPTMWARRGHHSG